MSNKTRLSQNTAIMLERARRAGITDEVLLNCVATGDVSALKVAEAEHYSYEDFVTYAAEHGEQLEQAIREDYQITFNTFNGLQLFLEFTFNVKRGVDFTPSEGRLSGLELSKSNVELLTSRLAKNWVLEIVDSNEETQKVNLSIRGLNN